MTQLSRIDDAIVAENVAQDYIIAAHGQTGNAVDIELADVAEAFLGHPVAISLLPKITLDGTSGVLIEIPSAITDSTYSRGSQYGDEVWNDYEAVVLKPGETATLSRYIWTNRDNIP
jgi:hypothetical protein